MATKTIRITEEVYDRLEARKREDESFTDLLARLTKQERDIYAGFGRGRAPTAPSGCERPTTN